MGSRDRPRGGGALMVQPELHDSPRSAAQRVQLDRPARTHAAHSGHGVRLRHGHSRLAVAPAGSHLDHRAEGLRMLSADGLTLDYGRGTELAHAVDQVTVSVEGGDFLGVIGPSGSGKSSLMYLLSGLKRPTRGRVTFEELEYGRLLPSALMRLRRERFGFVFQQHFLINYLSVLENVMVGATVRDRTTERWARELLARVGLEDKIDQRPYQLSIGQRQRVAVVRALVH